jgi:isopentenyl-diphosphate Delta-isomerase
MLEQVILVDSDDCEIGVMEKNEAHQSGALHRAFSIFIFNDKQELLLQQRSLSKYHSPGLWANTCCSHPHPNEPIHLAAKRRLMEEMGMACDLSTSFIFTYKAKMENELIEHEIDHVFIGFSSNNPILNKDEVADYQWMSLLKLKENIEANPSQYSVWLKIIMRQHYDKLIQLFHVKSL